MSRAILKTPEDYIERNIQTFSDKALKDKEFGTSYVQRICHISYNQARYTIEAMLERKIIDYAENSEWNYVFNT